MSEFTRRLNLNSGKVIVAIILVLSLFSFQLIFSTSGEWFNHTIHLLLSLVVMFIFSKIDYRTLSALGTIGLIVAAILLLITLSKGGTDSRSVVLFGFNLQTFYLIGFLVVFYIAKFLATRINKEQEITQQELIQLFIIIAGFCAGVFLTNQSTAIILFATCLVVLFVAKIPVKYLAYFTLAVLIAGTIFVAAGGGRSGTLKNRFTLWAHGYVEGVPEDYARQVVLSKAAISRSQLLPWGVGEGVIKVSLPARDNDYVFSVLVEEFGVIMSLFVIFLYLALLFQAMRIARNADGAFASLLAFGIGFWFSAQAFVHIGVNCGLIPSTGQTLPFISRGGTALIISGAAIGILLNIHKNNAELKAEST